MALFDTEKFMKRRRRVVRSKEDKEILKKLNESLDVIKNQLRTIESKDFEDKNEQIVNLLKEKAILLKGKEVVANRVKVEKAKKDRKLVESTIDYLKDNDVVTE